MSSYQMLFRPAGVGLVGFMAKVYDASILIDLGAPNGPDELPLRPAEGWVGTCFCPALPHIFTSSKNRDNSSGLHNPDVGLHYYQGSHAPPCGFFATTTIQPFLE